MTIVKVVEGIMEIAAGKFKAQCLKILEDVGNLYPELTITKRGVPMAKLIPIKQNSKVSLFGCAKDTVVFIGDIISPIHEKWNVDEN
jgi:antitoxin (DNA-binding transcriptional repressor) of toxin-antitoxin stability system